MLLLGLMGYSLVDTRGLSRWGSLRARAHDIANLVLGAAAMLLVAAGIEGFWSPSSAPPPLKWAAAAVFWLAVIVYFVFGGRRAGGRP